MLKKTVDLVAALEGIGLIATLILGIGCLSFVSVTWVLHLLGIGHIVRGASSPLPHSRWLRLHSPASPSLCFLFFAVLWSSE